MTKHWYRIDFSNGEKERMLCGSSPLAVTEFMAEVARGGFIRLDDLVYRDNATFRRWSDWEPRLEPFAYISSQSISCVMAFTGDPVTDPAK